MIPGNPRSALATGLWLAACRYPGRHCFRLSALPPLAANGRVEDLTEIYHSFYLTDHLSLSLIAQYAFHLAGDEKIEPREGVFLGGFRTQVNF